MQTLAKVIHGSNLFGTATPESDRDYKAVVLPSAREILLNSARDTINTSDAAHKNKAGEDDTETHTLSKYFKLLAEGQTSTVEMLFVPMTMHVCEPAPLWHDLLKARDRLISRKIESFVGYCREQAKKYSIKTERLTTAIDAVALFASLGERLGEKERLSAAKAEIEAFVAGHSLYAGFKDIELANGRFIRHLEINNRLIPETVNFQSALDIVAKVEKEYGARARRAANLGNKDWKAIAHAVRIAEEAVELLTTGNLIFPRPRAHYLMAIRTGQHSFEQISEEIESIVSDIDRAMLTTPLRAEPDIEFMTDFLIHAHLSAISKEFPMTARS